VHFQEYLLQIPECSWSQLSRQFWRRQPVPPATFQWKHW